MWFRSIFNGKAQGNDPSTGGRTPDSGLLNNQTMRQLNRLALNTGVLLPSQPVGARTSHTRRPASDFLDHRQYTPGDDVRYVDWKASARQEHIYIKQGNFQKAAFVYVLVDYSASMAWGDPPKSNAALALASALGYMALAHNDRLVVIPVTSSQPSRAARALGPLWGRGQAPLLNRYLQATRFQGEVEISHALAGLRSRKISSGGLVLVITDLLGTKDLARGLDALPAPDWRVVFLHTLHPAEIDPGLRGYYEMQDIETGQKKLYPVTSKVLEKYRQNLQSWQSELAQTCLERSAVYTMIPIDRSLGREILPQLLRARVVKRA